MLKFIQVALILSVSNSIFSLPDDIEKCRIDDEECLISSSNKVLRKYNAGITEIDLCSLNPFMIHKSPLKHDFGVIVADGAVYNIVVLGFPNATIVKFSGFEKNLLEIHMKMPKFTLSGTHKGSFNLLGFQINDEFPLTLNFYNFMVKLLFKLERYIRNDKEYFRIVETDISSDLNTGDLEAPDISKFILWTINTSFNILLKSSMRSYVGDTWGTYYEQVINAVLRKVPIEDLFLV